MPTTSESRRKFAEAIQTIRGTRTGQEAIMYPPLRDIFTDLLGYTRPSIRVDVAGQRGRPDLTVMAAGAKTGDVVPWIVVEAKDEHGAVAVARRRISLFAGKAKYITADTAFMVMVDPTMLVIRPASMGPNPAADIEIALANTSLEAFEAAATCLHADRAGVPETLKRFRAGDETLIAFDKLSYASSADEDTKIAVAIAQNVFFDSLKETTKLLQSAVEQSLRMTRADRDAIIASIAAFETEFGPARFTPYPISIEATVIDSREMEVAHRRAAAKLRRELSMQATLTRLVLDTLPRFALRIGKEITTEIDAIERIFAIETANLILARILLIRFLEDHGFFDSSEGRRRYLCNGGVQAFQGMREYFGHGYTRLLEDAYRVGRGFYAAAFDETEMDWIFALSDPDLSRTVEWSMFRFARFDFTTARGDLMTGVYDRFLDRAQRKAQGEYYTPPSIARYILDRLDLDESAEILDPACGSGTFPIERYRQVVGEASDRGLMAYEDAKSAAERLAANDINPFSAVLTQIQLLWHLLRFGRELKDKGFPELRVAERANSLMVASLIDPTQTRFSEIDRSGYDAVVGNPPYVRQERGADLNSASIAYFEGDREIGGKLYKGVPVERNAYGLFIYRALDHWCRQSTVGDGKPTGKLGFVVPLGFCVSEDTAQLRELFRPGGRWAIREIVDMELIWRDVFDARVLPMILIAEACAPKPDDVVSIRLADESCVVHDANLQRAKFDFSEIKQVVVNYADLFAPDGRILTRITPANRAILSKLWRLAKLEQAALPYWVPRSTKNRKERITTTEPTGHGATSLWTREILIKSGVAMRGKIKAVTNGGWTVYKGENIRTAGIFGAPVFENVDVSQASGPYVWAYAHIFPDRVWVIPMIEQVPVAAPIDPRLTAVLNTASVVALRPEFASVPLDLILLSRPYVWSFAIAWRSSYLDQNRTHIYPTVIASLPWTSEFLNCSSDIEAIRAPLLDLCQRRYEANERLREGAANIGLVPLQRVARDLSGATLSHSPEFDDVPSFSLEVGEVTEIEGAWVLPVSASGHKVEFNNKALAQSAALGLGFLEGDEDFSWTAILRAPVPPDPETIERVVQLQNSMQATTIDVEIEKLIDRIDALVGPALGLSEADLLVIREDMSSDPYLSRITPRYPYFRPKQRGRRVALESSRRYARA